MRCCFALLLVAASAVAQRGADRTGVPSGGTDRTYAPVTMTFQVTEAQTLADGTHITNVRHEVFYADSQGRTRLDAESPFPAGEGLPRYSVMVRDPVARFSLSWQTGGNSSMTHQFSSLDLDSVIRVPATRQRTPDAATDPPLPKLQRTLDSTHSSPGDRPQPRHSSKKLGSQQVQGLTCEASRMTTAYPVGAIGNDREITSTSERCVSQEFRRALREVMQDPRTGTRVLELQSFTRGEPDPMLFHPPADYTERSQTP